MITGGGRTHIHSTRELNFASIKTDHQTKQSKPITTIKPITTQPAEGKPRIERRTKNYNNNTNSLSLAIEQQHKKYEREYTSWVHTVRFLVSFFSRRCGEQLSGYIVPVPIKLSYCHFVEIFTNIKSHGIRPMLSFLSHTNKCRHIHDTHQSDMLNF